MEIYYIDRKTGEKKKETVAGDVFLRWMYETKLGSSVLESLLKKKLFSNFYGKLQDLPSSRRKIAAFIKDLEIDITEAEVEDLYQYNNFNDFFIRKLKKESRPICKDKKSFISPADGRVFAYDNIDIKELIQVKGQEYSLEELINNKELAQLYKEGVCLIVRLNPSDYHRFHFPDGGIAEKSTKINGDYYSVNPIALKNVAKIYCKNKREITTFHSDNFGKILMIEVGATCVGTIIQTYKPSIPVKKGEEKGYFKFGGSTTILFLQRNKVKIDKDLIENTSQGLETKVNMGEKIGTYKTS